MSFRWDFHVFYYKFCVYGCLSIHTFIDMLSVHLYLHMPLPVMENDPWRSWKVTKKLLKKHRNPV